MTFARSILRLRLAAIALLIAFPAVRATASAQTLTTVIMATPSTDDVTPALYAQKSGIFRKYGLDVQIQHMNSGAAIIAAMSGGAVNIGCVSILGLVSAYVHGVPIQIVAPAGIYDNDAQALFITRKAASFQSGKDLNGAVIGSPALKDLNALASMAWIDQHGGDSSKVKVELAPIPRTPQRSRRMTGDGVSWEKIVGLLAMNSSEKRSVVRTCATARLRRSLAS